MKRDFALRRISLRLSVALVVVCVTACSRKIHDYKIPPNAQRIGDMACVTLKAGDGRAAMSGGIWGVETTLISHVEPGCEYPCKRDMLYPRFSHQLEPWNAVVKSMREGEVRRVWLKLPRRRDPVVYDIKLASVVRVDSAGKPVIEN